MIVASLSIGFLLGRGSTWVVPLGTSGLSLGKNPMDKATYAAASVAADVFKLAAPLFALSSGTDASASLLRWLRALARPRELVDGFSRRLCIVEPR